MNTFTNGLFTALPPKTEEALGHAHASELRAQAMSDEARDFVTEALEISVGFVDQNSIVTFGFSDDRREEIETSVAALIGDLLSQAMHEEAKGFMYHPRIEEAFEFARCKFEYYRLLRRKWRSLGWIETLPATFLQDDDFFIEDYGNCGEFLRATADLLDLAEAHGITPANVRDHFQVAPWVAP